MTMPVMNTIVRCGTIVGLLMLAAACNADGPTAPSWLRVPPSTVQPPPAPVPPPPAPVPPPPIPPFSGPTTTYVFSGPLSCPVSGFTTASKYVLYDSGAFSFQYVSLAEYVGSYRLENGRIDFYFSGDVAAGTLNGD